MLEDAIECFQNTKNRILYISSKFLPYGDLKNKEKYGIIIWNIENNHSYK